MSLTDRERERIADTIADVFTPYGRDFDPEDGARLLEARLETLLREREERGRAEGLAEVRDFAREIVDYERDHAAGADTPMRLAIARDLLEIVEGR